MTMKLRKKLRLHGRRAAQKVKARAPAARAAILRAQQQPPKRKVPPKGNELNVKIRIKTPPKPAKRVMPKQNPAHVAALARWQAGSPIYPTLCGELGIHSSHTLVKIFVTLLGGKEAYLAARAAGAGGGHVPFGGKPFVRTKGMVSAPTFDDSKVPRVPYRTRMKKWRPTEVIRYADGMYPVAVAPDGTRYVRAKATERADLLFEWKNDGWDYSAIGPVMRMRRLETSNVVKKAKRAEKLVVKGEKLLKHRSLVRRARRHHK